MTEVKKNDVVLYKQRQYTVLLVDGGYLLLKDVKNHETIWVLRTLVMKL